MIKVSDELGPCCGLEGSVLRIRGVIRNPLAHDFGRNTRVGGLSESCKRLTKNLHDITDYIPPPPELQLLEQKIKNISDNR